MTEPTELERLMAEVLAEMADVERERTAARQRLAEMQREDNHELNMKRLGMHRPTSHSDKFADLANRCPDCRQNSLSTVNFATEVYERAATKTVCTNCGWSPGRSQGGNGLPTRWSTVPLHNNYIQAQTHWE